MFDGNGCTKLACIPGCKYYLNEDRVEDSEVESWYEDYRSTRGEENRKRREAKTEVFWLFFELSQRIGPIIGNISSIV